MLVFIPLLLGDGHQVESLHSYVAAVACANKWSAKQLAEYLGEIRLQGSSESIPRRKHLIYKHGSMSGHSHLTQAVIQLLEKQGAEAVARATFIGLRPVCGDSHFGLFSPYRKWCSECFLQDIKNRHRPYARLIWQVAATSICLVHRISLETQCPHCRKRQPLECLLTTVNCVFCSQALAQPPRETSPILRLNPVDFAFANVISEGESFPERIYAFQSIVLFICAYQRLFDQADKTAYRNWILTRRESGWIRLQKRASLPGLVRLSIDTGVSVQFILISPLEAATAAVFKIKKAPFFITPAALPILKKSSIDLDIEDISKEMYLRGDLWIPGPTLLVDSFKVKG